jgi:AbrB family looped-hinge helix DNA binding protein
MTRGRVTIPAAIRRESGLLPGVEVTFEVRGDGVLVRPADGVGQTRGEAIVRHLSGRGSIPITSDQLMAMTRGEEVVARMRGSATTRMTTDEIMALMRGESEPAGSRSRTTAPREPSPKGH